MRKCNTTTTPESTPTLHTLFYRNFMNSRHKDDEKILKDLIRGKVTMKDDNKLKLVIYYKSMKTRDMVMKNNLGKKVRDLSKTNVIYDSRCKRGGCERL